MDSVGKGKIKDPQTLCETLQTWMEGMALARLSGHRRKEDRPQQKLISVGSTRFSERYTGRNKAKGASGVKHGFQSR